MTGNTTIEAVELDMGNVLVEPDYQADTQGSCSSMCCWGPTEGAHGEPGWAGGVSQ